MGKGTEWELGFCKGRQYRHCIVYYTLRLSMN